jgi:hypothetical protein
MIPICAFAQEAVLTGTITDSTGAVLPGVTVTVVHEASGNRFVAVTDERGVYRIPARVGGYQIAAELQGFATAQRSNIELLVGQTLVINLQMAPSGVAETVTVSGEAPLINVATSQLGGNIDPQQVAELPAQGRNWMALAMLAPGSRMTSDTATTPIANRGAAGDVRQYQFSLDGQQVTSEMGFGNQPRYSQESISEFQYISNRFDATMGRSAAVQVIAVTKSGTNRFSGSARGNFRDSRLNEPDPVIHKVVPIDNQQLGLTLGGPIRKDRLHFFTHFDYEREPKTSVWNTPYPAFNVELHGPETVKMGGARLDYQLSSSMRIMGKITDAEHWQPFTPGNNSHPAATGSTLETNREYAAQFTHVISNRAVNEINGGKTRWIFENANLTHWSHHWQAANGVTTGSPRITFGNFTIGGNAFYPRFGAQDNWSLRDNFTYSYDAHGRHDVKAGADAVVMVDSGNNCQSCMGTVDARNARPSAAELTAWFPDAWDADTWNMNAISPLILTYSIGVGNYATRDVRPQYGTWFQDDWQIAPKLTLNLGARYDLSLNANGNNYAVPPFVDKGRPADKNNIQPRAGFAYRLTPNTVLRGGTGVYFLHPAPDRHVLHGTDRSPRCCPVHERRAAGLRLQSHERSAAAVGGPGAAAVLPRPQRSRVSAALTSGACRAGRLFDSTGPHVAELNWVPASDWCHDGCRGGLRLQPGTQREGRHLEHEPDVQSGHRRELSVLRHLTSRLPRFRRDFDGGPHGPLALSRASNRRDQTLQQSLAGRRDLHAVRSVGRVPDAVFRNHAGGIQDDARSRRRMVSVVRRPASPGGAERYLGSRPRLSVEQCFLYRYRRARDDDLRAGRTQHRRRRRTGIDKPAARTAGRDDCAAQLVHAAGAAQTGSARSAESDAAAPRDAGWDCRGVQRLQLAKLDDYDD